jgi:Restriction endonuclease
MDKKQPVKNRLERKDWRDYELQILKVYREKYSKRLVLDNRRIKGEHSKRLRQIDVLVYKKGGKKIDIIIECKNLNKKVTVGTLDAFYGKLHDLGISKGIIITTKGFSLGTKNYAQSKNITLDVIDYEYLKDYYYILPNEVPEVFNKAIRYAVPFCSKCDISILYEIGEVYGMAEHEPLYCPKCKIQLTKVRSDANHRVIKIFRGTEVSETEIDVVIAKHIDATRNEWASDFYLFDIPITEDKNCFVCKYEFCESPPTRAKNEYKNKNICSECLMSRRTLLLDYNYL